MEIPLQQLESLLELLRLEFRPGTSKYEYSPMDIECGVKDRFREPLIYPLS